MIVENPKLKVQCSIVLAGGHPNQLVTNRGHYLRRDRVIEAIVDLQLYLGRELGYPLNATTVRAGVETMLENPHLGQYVMAWSENNQIVGQLEIKKRSRGRVSIRELMQMEIQKVSVFRLES